MNKVKVLQLFSSFEVGGAEKLLVEFFRNSTNLDDVEFDIAIIKNIVDDGLLNSVKNLGYKPIIFKKGAYKNPLTLFRLLKIAKEKKIDIIHTHEDVKYWSILCKIFCPKLKLVFTSHGNNDIKEYNWLKFIIHKHFIDNTIVISNPIKESCESRGITKATVIYNGTDLKKYKNTNTRDFYSEKLNIINVSRIMHEVKGQDVLINALKLCKDTGIKFHCSFVGGTYEYETASGSLQYLKNLVKENQLENEITFLGNRADVPDLLNQSNLFVLPSRMEAMPLVLLEAMASGLPTISSNIPVVRWLINDYENGIIFQNDNHKELAEKIEYLYNNREKMQEIAENGSNFVKDFDILVMVEKYHNLYKSLVKV